MKKWNVISDIILNKKRSEFLIWVKEMNPKFYENLIENESEK